jgi:hypothetical protein
MSMYLYQQQYQPLYRNYAAIGQGPATPPAAPSVPTPAPVSDGGVSTGVVVAEKVLSVAFAGAVAYTGIRAGLKEKGLGSAAGWVAGVGGGLLGLTTLVGVVSPQLAHKVNPFRFA